VPKTIQHSWQLAIGGRNRSGAPVIAGHREAHDQHLVLASASVGVCRAHHRTLTCGKAPHPGTTRHSLLRAWTCPRGGSLDEPRSSGAQYRDEQHVYADDLDLFGRGSLFAMLALPRTAAGEATLASWLLAPASSADVLARQETIRELRPALDLREDLALLGEDVRSEVHAEKLTAWGSGAPITFRMGFA
jgi:hypothetical protein